MKLNRSLNWLKWLVDEHCRTALTTPPGVAGSGHLSTTAMARSKGAGRKKSTDTSSKKAQKVDKVRKTKASPPSTSENSSPVAAEDAKHKIAKVSFVCF